MRASLLAMLTFLACYLHFRAGVPYPNSFDFSWIINTAVAPSPAAEAACLVDLMRTSPVAINLEAKTLLNLRESWENATQEEQRELVHLMLQEVGCSIREQQVIWVKPKQEFVIFQRLVDDLKPAENGVFRLLAHNGHKGLSGI